MNIGDYITRVMDVKSKHLLQIDDEIKELNKYRDTSTELKFAREKRKMLEDVFDDLITNIINNKGRLSEHHTHPVLKLVDRPKNKVNEAYKEHIELILWSLERTAKENIRTVFEDTMFRYYHPREKEEFLNFLEDNLQVRINHERIK